MSDGPDIHSDTVDEWPEHQNDTSLADLLGSVQDDIRARDDDREDAKELVFDEAAYRERVIEAYARRRTVEEMMQEEENDPIPIIILQSITLMKMLGDPATREEMERRRLLYDSLN